MRYADHACAHIESPEHQQKDPDRSNVIDRRAKEAGFDNSADYVDDVMGRSETRSFEGANGRTIWANPKERLMGVNNAEVPQQSTVIPRMNEKITEKDFERQKEKEAPQLGIEKNQIQERGPIAENDRQAPDVEQQREQGRTSKPDRPGAIVGSASKPRDQEQVLKEAQDKQRETPGEELNPDQRRAALHEASARVEKDQEALKEAWQRENDPKVKEQIALKAGIEQADFNRHAANERADLAAEEKGPQSIEALRTKRESREAEATYDQGVADWHKRSVRDSDYERYDDKWSHEAKRAEEREASSTETQAEKNAVLDQQFDTSQSMSHGHSR